MLPCDSPRNPHKPPPSPLPHPSVPFSFHLPPPLPLLPPPPPPPFNTQDLTSGAYCTSSSSKKKHDILKLFAPPPSLEVPPTPYPLELYASLLRRLLRVPFPLLFPRWSPTTDPPCTALHDLISLSYLSTSSSLSPSALKDFYWQSDAAGAPEASHTLTFQFARPLWLVEFRFFALYEGEESYTPAVISLAVGTHRKDTQPCGRFKLLPPQPQTREMGWVCLPLHRDSKPKGNAKGVWGSFLEVQVRRNQRGGRDSRMRGVKIYGRRA